MWLLILVGLAVLNSRSTAEHVHSENTFAGFGRSDHHALKLHKAVELLKSGRCKHIYVDMGTNVGIQIRKLYEPHYYPTSPILPIYEKYFGNGTSELRKSVCGFGFEGNPVHTPRLEAMEKAYNEAGFPLVMFSETAVATYTGNMTFYMDVKSRAEKHQWGASANNWNHLSEKDSVVAGAINVADFLHMVHSILNHVSDAETLENMRVVGKIDVESAEFSVIPNLMYQGLLCKYHFLYVEWHVEMMLKGRNPNDLLSKEMEWYPYVLNYEISQIPQVSVLYAMCVLACNRCVTVRLSMFCVCGCLVMQCKQLTMSWMDDESYGSGEDRNPLPSPVSRR
jgi:hypothetical protein